MDKKTQIDVFAAELDKMVDKMAFELSLTNAELIGTMVIKTAKLIIEALGK